MEGPQTILTNIILIPEAQHTDLSVGTLHDCDGFFTFGKYDFPLDPDCIFSFPLLNVRKLLAVTASEPYNAEPSIKLVTPISYKIPNYIEKNIIIY